ncbi:MAG: glycine oxidase ThiO [Acidimicrobiales bacterium]
MQGYSGVVPDVVIAGAGVIGLSIAWKAAEQGMRVALCDPTPGQGATWAAAGMLAPVTEAHIGEEDIVRMNLAAAARWPSFTGELQRAAGTEIGYVQSGTIVVAVDASDMAVVDRMLAFHATLRLVSSRITASECRRLVPVLTPGIRGGASAPQDHQVDNRRLALALEQAAVAAGVEMIPAAVADILVSGGAGRSGGGMRATGVRLSDGQEIPAGNVVIAAGCWTPNIGGDFPAEVLPPIRPVKGHILRVKGDPAHPLIDRNVRCMVHGSYVYIVPRADGTIVIGATVEEMGYDRRVQAGAVYDLLRDARTAIPGIADLELSECFTGLRPGSPDNGPFIGWTSLEGLAVATGHYRNGILLAPITADAITAALLGEEVPEFVGPFRADRETRMSAVARTGVVRTGVGN